MNEREYMNAIEAILFASGAPVEASRLSAALEISVSDAVSYSESLKKEYEARQGGLAVIKLDDSYQLVSVKKYAQYIRKAMDLRRNIPLSQAALEVLAVVAYNQPVTKAFVEQVRGVDCSGVLGSLTTKGLVEEKGRLELPGRPLLYGTTDNFLRCFSISSLDELPTLPDKEENPLENPDNDAQLSIFESEKGKTDSADDSADEVADDDMIEATVEEIIEQASTD